MLDSTSESEEILDRGDKDVHDFEKNEDFEATDVLVFTWYGMVASPWGAFYRGWCDPSEVSV